MHVLFFKGSFVAAPRGGSVVPWHAVVQRWVCASDSSRSSRHYYKCIDICFLVINSFICTVLFKERALKEENSFICTVLFKERALKEENSFICTVLLKERALKEENDSFICTVLFKERALKEENKFIHMHCLVQGEGVEW
jgi:sulfur relay (sulfurtransferase) DsrF/TusC family protein